MNPESIEFERKNPDGPLMVLAIGRISTDHQNIENIEASYEDDERYLRRLSPGEMHIKHLGERGSGWKINRATIKEALEGIESGIWDVAIMEDIGRAYRNPQFQYMIAHLCVDHDTRLICTGDSVDTTDPNWESALGAAVMRHGMTVPETRRRVKRTATFAFHRGGMVLKIRFGYRRLTQEEAASGEHGPKGLRIARVAELTSTIREMRERVLRGESYETIARWLNDSEVPPGEYVVLKEWTGRLVADFLRNPVFHGMRVFRKKEHKLIFSTGEPRRAKNANPEFRYVPELAHITKEEQEELWAAMDRYSPPRGQHKRKGVARRKSYWPGQHLRCAVCGAEMYWSARGNLKYCNTFPGRAKRCWNRVIVDAEQVRTKLFAALLSQLRSRPDIIRALLDAAWSEFQRMSLHGARKLQRIEACIAEQIRDRERITTLLIKLPDSDGLLERLGKTEREIAQLQQEAEQERSEFSKKVHCLTRDEVEARLDEAVLHLARTSYEFGALMRRTFPDFQLVPAQALDTSQVRPRVKLVLPADDSTAEPMTIVIDAFNAPQQIQFATACSQLKAEHPDWSLVPIGRSLGIGKKAVGEALKYAKVMADQSVTDPYLELLDEPPHASRWGKRLRPEADEAVDQTSNSADQSSGGRSSL